MHKWQYFTLTRGRSIKGSWTGVYAEADSWDVNIEESLTKLGEEGWELIAVVSESSIAGTHGAGFTSNELWVFKRPKPGQLLTQTLATERSTEARKFSLEARASLAKLGFVIYSLRGKSLETLHTETAEPVLDDTQLQQWVGGQWVKRPAPGDFWYESSPATEVAIRPDHAVLPGSDDKSYKQHQGSAAAFSADISSKVSGASAIIGTASYYVELALIHRKSTGNHLFKTDVRLVTSSVYKGDGEYMVQVGRDEKGLRTWEYWLGTQGAYDVWLMPLVVP